MTWASRFLTLGIAVMMCGAAFAEEGEKKTRAEKKRAEINGRAKAGLDRLFGESSEAKKLYDKAYGYAVFDTIKISLMFTGGGGTGVAVSKEYGERTYMKMATGGINIGLGGQKYSIVFLFQTKARFDNFVEKGWDADASANAVGGKAGKNLETTFRNGVAIYQLTKGGLMLQVDVSGTKYWKNKKLNR